MIKRILIIIIVVLILAQFLQPSNKNNGIAESATDITHTIHVPDSVLSILKQSCYDCHSNHTNYPWYNKITPVNYFLDNHVRNGKKELNYTTFGTYSYKKMARKLDETAEIIEKGNMPLHSYLWIHKDAALRDAQQKTLIDCANAAKEEVMRDSTSGKTQPTLKN